MSTPSGSPTTAGGAGDPGPTIGSSSPTAPPSGKPMRDIGFELECVAVLDRAWREGGRVCARAGPPPLRALPHLAALAEPIFSAAALSALRAYRGGVVRSPLGGRVVR